MAAPSGTVTFLFTDIEGSTRLWQAAPDAMRAALERHDSIVRSAIDKASGYVFSTGGDAFAAAFARAGDALAAALSAQMGLVAEQWPEGAAIRVRMGLHTGEAHQRGGDYYGPAVIRAARLMDAGHGGQVLLSRVSAELAGDALPTGCFLVELGQYLLRDLGQPETVFQLVHPALTRQFPPLRTLDVYPGNLPRQVSSFIGRDREMARVAKALQESALVTMTGVGGVGKSRLALQAAADVLPRYRDGAWLIELAGVRDASQVVDAVVATFALTVAPETKPLDAFIDFLRHKQMLLVVDNAEHLISAVAQLVTTVVAACPGVSVLVTSREGLAVDGERIIPVPSLTAPDAGDPFDVVVASESVRLFIDRAVAVDPDFALTEDNAAPVTTICRRLDGIPLAVELAAARIPAMAPAELVGRLDRRFQLLAGGRRGAIERHQTLRAAIDWSYDLLDEGQQRLLARLSVFAGGWTLDAAEAVCADDVVAVDVVFDRLAALVARSLVVANHHGAVTRYRLLETIRQYGEDHLPPVEQESLRARHAAYYAALAEGFMRNAFGPGQIEWSRRVRAEGDNLIAAMNWAIERENADLALRIGANLYHLFQVGYSVVISVEPALSMTLAADHPLYPQALAVSAADAVTQGNRQFVEDRCARALDAERRLGNPSRGLVDAWISMIQAVLDATHGLFELSMEKNIRAAEVLLGMGNIGGAAYQYATAASFMADTPLEDGMLDLATKALGLARQSGMPTAIGVSLQSVASALARRDPPQARKLLLEALEGMAHLRYEDCNELAGAVFVSARLGDSRLALDMARQAIPLVHWLNERSWLFGVLTVVVVALADPEPATAAVLQGAARSIARTWTATQTSSEPPASDQRAVHVIEFRREANRRLAANLSEEDLQRLRQQGEAMDQDQAVAYALGEIDRALANHPTSIDDTPERPALK